MEKRLVKIGEAAAMLGLTRWHNARVDSAVASERLGAVYAKQLADAQAKADEKTQANANQKTVKS